MSATPEYGWTFSISLHRRSRWFSGRSSMYPTDSPPISILQGYPLVCIALEKQLLFPALSIVFNFQK